MIRDFNLIERLRRREGVLVGAMCEGWDVAIDKAALRIELTIPTAVLEWFVSIQNANGEEIWSDWMEHYATNGETRAHLRYEMEHDIEHFVDRVILRSVRVTGENVEWLDGENWQPVALAP